MAITTPVARGSTTSTANSSSAAVNCSGAATEGNLLVYLLSNGDNVTLSSVAGGGATWAVSESKNVAATGTTCSLAWCIVPAGGIADTTTITGTLSANSSRKAIALVEVGVDGGWSWPASPVDKHTNASGTSTSSWSSGTTATTTSANEIVFNVYSNAGNCTAFAVGGSYSLAPFNSGTGLLVVSSGSTPRSLAAEYLIVSATGAQSDTNAVTTSAGNYANAIVTFAPTVPAAATTKMLGLLGVG